MNLMNLMFHFIYIHFNLNYSLKGSSTYAMPTYTQILFVACHCCREFQIFALWLIKIKTKEKS